MVLYNAVTSASENLARVSAAIDWERLSVAENATKREDETPMIKQVLARMNAGAFTEEIATDLRARILEMRRRTADALSELAKEKSELERRLPPLDGCRYFED